MSRGGSYGGGKSSLHYLFESEESNQNLTNSKAKQTQQSHAIKHETDEAYRTGTLMSKPEDKSETEENSKTNVVQEGKSQKNTSNQSSIHFHTGRPSTKVNSVPGGRSSLGYLFGDS